MTQNTTWWRLAILLGIQLAIEPLSYVFLCPQFNTQESFAGHIIVPSPPHPFPYNLILSQLTPVKRSDLHVSPIVFSSIWCLHDFSYPSELYIICEMNLTRTKNVRKSNRNLYVHICLHNESDLLTNAITVIMQHNRDNIEYSMAVDCVLYRWPDVI